jgi:hypothetical protein
MITCISYIALAALLTVIFVSTTLALELPEDVRGYYKDNVTGSPGVSEGVPPTVEKADTKEGVDMGRRETREYDFSNESPGALTAKSWEALNKKDERAVLAYTSRCIELYQEDAEDQEARLDDFAPSGSEADYEALNNVAVSYFIRGEFYKHKKDWGESRKNYKKVIDGFYFAQCWDPRGWWWKPSEISGGEIEKIDSEYYEKQ